MAETRRVRFGVTVGRGTPREVLEQARLAVAFGFDSVWMMDHLNGFPIEEGALEPFAMLGAMALNCPGVLLGCAATDPFRRHPAILAHGLGTLAGLNQGPVALVIGAGEAMNLRPFGFVAERPLATVRESLHVIRQLVHSSAESMVHYDGHFFRLDSAFLQFGGAVGPTHLYVAANGAAGIRIAGESADGWVSLLRTPELLAEGCASLGEVAQSAGRSRSEVDIAHHIDIGIGADVSTAVSLVRDSAAKLLLGFPRAGARLGLQLSDDFDWRRLVVNKANQRALATAMRSVPDSAVVATAIVGNEDECVRRIDEYVEAGATHFIFRCANRIDEVGAFLRRSVRGRY